MEPGSSGIGAHHQEVAEKAHSSRVRTVSRSQTRAQRKKAVRLRMEQLARDLHLTGERMSVWALLPINLLIGVFRLLPLPDRGRCSVVCKHWNVIYHMPDLWHEFVFQFMQRTAMGSSSTPELMIKQIFEKHSGDLRQVTIKVDTHRQSVETACDVLFQLENCSLQSLQLMTVVGPSFTLVEPKKVVTALTQIVSNSPLKLLAVEETPIDDDLLEILAAKSQATLASLKINGCQSLSATRISSALCSCMYLCELSMDYSHLSDTLLQALFAPPHVAMKKLNIIVVGLDYQSNIEAVSLPSVSSGSWDLLAQHSPNVSFSLHLSILREEHYFRIFHCKIPVTTLHFGSFVPIPILHIVSRTCPSLQVLLISSSDDEPINEAIISIGEKCKELRALELGSCIVNCTVVVQLAKLCGPRLKTLVIPEDTVLEDSECDILRMSQEVSHFLQRTWDVVFMPTWFE